MTILVTGGCGFIGSNFVRLVLEKRPDHKIVNLDKLTYAGNPANLAEFEKSANYRFVQGDICDREAVERIFAEEQIDTVVHFAAESHVDRSIEGPAAFIETNILGTFNLLEAARSAWSKNGDESSVISDEKKNTDHSSPVTRHRFLHVSTDEVYGSLGETGLFKETTAYDPRSPYSASKASSD
nr:NAD-dependent epimerase/dehydratase family protein [Desulfuromonadales bacterium]